MLAYALLPGRACGAKLRVSRTKRVQMFCLSRLSAAGLSLASARSYGYDGRVPICNAANRDAPPHLHVGPNWVQEVYMRCFWPVLRWIFQALAILLAAVALFNVAPKWSSPVQHVNSVNSAAFASVACSTSASDHMQKWVWYKLQKVRSSQSWTLPFFRDIFFNATSPFVLDEVNMRVVQFFSQSIGSKILAVFAFATPIVIVFGLTYKMTSGKSLRHALFKAYAVLQDVPGASACDEEDTRSAWVLNLVHVVRIVLTPHKCSQPASAGEVQTSCMHANSHWALDVRSVHHCVGGPVHVRIGAWNCGRGCPVIGAPTQEGQQRYSGERSYSDHAHECYNEQYASPGMLSL
jgi:hypothetical protein